jgi:sugar lactone lactonase YvrE
MMSNAVRRRLLLVGVSVAAAVVTATALAVSPSSSITTVAGTGKLGFSGDGGKATAAQLNYPEGVAVDSRGNVYIAEAVNFRVRKVSRDGTITTFAGTGKPGFSGDGGPASAAQLNHPYGVAVDTRGNLYIADYNNFRVRKVTPAGTITTFAGSGYPLPSGNGGPAAKAGLGAPQAVATDTRGNVYIAETGHQRVLKVTPDGTIATIAGSGKLGFSGDGGPAIRARMRLPTGVAADGRGNVYIADSVNNRVRLVNRAGRISTFAGNGKRGFSGDGGPASAAQLASPHGLAVDRQGNLHIGDELNARIRKVNRRGIISTVAGSGSFGFGGDGGPATAAFLSSPWGVAVDRQRNLYIADTNNHRVRKVRAGQ